MNGLSFFTLEFHTFYRKPVHILYNQGSTEQHMINCCLATWPQPSILLIQVPWIQLYLQLVKHLTNSYISVCPRFCLQNECQSYISQILIEGKKVSLLQHPFLLPLQLKKDQLLRADEMTANIQRPARKSVTKMLCKSSILLVCFFVKAKELHLGLRKCYWDQNQNSET